MMATKEPTFFVRFILFTFVLCTFLIAFSTRKKAKKKLTYRGFYQKLGTSSSNGINKSFITSNNNIQHTVEIITKRTFKSIWSYVYFD